MFYDLHIHSALSPCSDDDMTLNNIVNMSYIKGLDLIAISDHNSIKQLYHLDKVAKGKIDYVYAVEIQSREEVHILAYFLKDTCLDHIQSFLDKYLIEEPNDYDYFGHQYILNEYDEIIEEESRLLLKSLDLSVKEVIDHIHQLGGIAVFAHALSKRFSIMSIYLEIDESFDFDAIEVKTQQEKEFLQNEYPFLENTLFLFNSDAHCLDTIQEPIHELNQNDFYGLWRKRYG